jgi:hypothetical protein
VFTVLGGVAECCEKRFVSHAAFTHGRTRVVMRNTRWVALDVASCIVAPGRIARFG